jgi:SAM-dependent methyltransferase
MVKLLTSLADAKMLLMTEAARSGTNRRGGDGANRHDLPAGQRGGILAMADDKIADVQDSYDRVADEYVARIFGELEHKPLDRQLLDRFGQEVRNLGPVCDIGCGPGQVARYLHDKGVQVRGLDLSPALVEAARKLSPGIEFARADMRSLPIEDDSLGGIVAFYSIIHIPRPDIVSVLTEFKRVLRPGGLLLLVFHIGQDTVHLDEWWGRRVSVDFHFFSSEEMRRYLQEAGFRIVEIIERDPYPSVEYRSRRAYLFADKPPKTCSS